MFKQDHAWKVQSSAWIGVSSAVISAVITTQSAWPLIALIIPLLVGGDKSNESKT